MILRMGYAFILKYLDLICEWPTCVRRKNEVLDGNIQIFVMNYTFQNVKLRKEREEMEGEKPYLRADTFQNDLD